MSESMDRAARDWLAAREVIIRFLAEMEPSAERSALEHNAAALIARLVSIEILPPRKRDG